MGPMGVSVKKQTKKKMSVPYEPFLLEDLKDPEFAAGYLSACLNGYSDEEFEIFFDALLQVVKAHGVTLTAARMKVTRNAVQKMFKKHQNPTLKSFRKMLSAMDMDFTIIPKAQTV